MELVSFIIGIIVGSLITDVCITLYARRRFKL